MVHIWSMHKIHWRRQKNLKEQKQHTKENKNRRINETGRGRGLFFSFWVLHRLPACSSPRRWHVWWRSGRHLCGHGRTYGACLCGQRHWPWCLHDHQHDMSSGRSSGGCIPSFWKAERRGRVFLISGHGQQAFSLFPSVLLYSILRFETLIPVLPGDDEKNSYTGRVLQKP